MSFFLRGATRTLGALVVALACCGCAAPGAERPPVLRVGTSGDYAPFSERASEAGRDWAYRGLDIAIARRFAADEGLEVAWVPFRWPDLLGSLEADRFDVAMSGVTVRPERSLEGRFSVPVAQTGAVLLVRDALLAERGMVGSQDVSALDVTGLRITVNAGGHLERVTRKQFVGATIRAIPDNAAVPGQLLSGSADAVVTDTLEAPHWLAELPDVSALGPFTRDFKAYWVAPENADLAHRLDAWLIAREWDGSLAALRAEWVPGVAMEETARPRAALLAASDERLALMPFVAGFKRANALGIVDAAREEKVLAAGQRAVERAAARLGVEAPDAAAVRRFYRAQIDAAVEIQQRALEEPEDPTLARFDLQDQLRPALIRIGDRMAGLIVRAAGAAEAAEAEKQQDRVGKGASEPAATVDVVARVLVRHDLSPARLKAIADAIDGLVYHPAR